LSPTYFFLEAQPKQTRAVLDPAPNQQILTLFVTQTMKKKKKGRRRKEKKKCVAILS
jgi:hypothetical protein